jgi:hypothetical protein
MTFASVSAKVNEALSIRRVKFYAGCVEGFQVRLKHEKAIHLGD